MNHTIRKETHTLTFWKDGEACGPLDGPNKVELKVNGDWPVFEFNSSCNRECAKLETALQKAFEAGAKNKSKLLRELIGAAQT